MLSPQLRRQIFDLWTLFWSSGITNPLTAIEQITYLIFLKRLEPLDDYRIQTGKRSIYGVRQHCQLPHPGSPETCPGHDYCRWSYIKKHTAGDPKGAHRQLSKYVFSWLREIDRILQETNGVESHTHVFPRLEDAFFQLAPDKTTTLQEAVRKVDALFSQVGERSANYDLMGDIFEYLLSEIQTSGKNGQFRTPRHIIRFMVELLNPESGNTIIDPAYGTGGFLINSLLHIVRKSTPDQQVKLEWDGTPHGLSFDNPAIQPYLNGQYFVGYDNDRTMARIGWMNMVLHGIEAPQTELKDTLSYKNGSNLFDRAFANPPFTGSVDAESINAERFPKNPRNPKDIITKKTELLFLWLLLDLLKENGRAAVIVPEGVLFGSTLAHRELRRQLLFEHLVEGVISLPAGVFLPYTGVKTSILIFQKKKHSPTQGQPPCTEKVWFYEVTNDGYTLDAKRDDKPEPNDLWDALAKWPQKIVDSKEYYQPRYFEARWRLVDNQTAELFPELKKHLGRILDVQELFGLPCDPQAAREKIETAQTEAITNLYNRFSEVYGTDVLFASIDPKQQFNSAPNLSSIFSTAMEDYLDKEGDRLSRDALKSILEKVREVFHSRKNSPTVIPPTMTLFAGNQPAGKPDWEVKIRRIVLEFARLDGYTIKLRTPEVYKIENQLSESKSWFAPVRVLLRNDEWMSEDGKIQGSHDEAGIIRPEYLADPSLYEKDNTIQAKYLDPDCIEANDLNLSAGRYKQKEIIAVDYGDPETIIAELQELETQIQTGLARLLEMVREAE